MKKRLYIYLKNRGETDKRIRNYIEFETKKGEDKTMNKIEYMRKQKALKEEKESKEFSYFVRFTEVFLNGETMTMLERINKIAYWLFVEMVFETNRTAGFIHNKSGLLRKIIVNTERNVGYRLTIDEIVKALNTLIIFGLIKKSIMGTRILNYSRFYYSA